jgi:hypothetical protein
MSRIQFTPGRKGNIRNLINNIYLCGKCSLYQNCKCIQERVDQIKTGYNNPEQTQAGRVSQLVTGTLGGRITFGNFGIPATLTYLGGIEGQPGGSPKPLRNKF